MRESTERPEGIHAGVAELVGSNRKAIVDKVSLALTDPDYYHSFQRSVNPYGDGYSADRILDHLNILSEDQTRSHFEHRSHSDTKSSELPHPSY